MIIRVWLLQSKSILYNWGVLVLEDRKNFVWDKIRYDDFSRNFIIILKRCNVNLSAPRPSAFDNSTNMTVFDFVNFVRGSLFFNFYQLSSWIYEKSQEHHFTDDTNLLFADNSSKISVN